MNRKSIDLMVGLFVLLGAAALLFLALKAANLASFSFGETYSVRAKFDNIGGLKARAPVKSAGVVVGRVVDISFDDKQYQAVVTLALDRKFQFPKDSSAKILTSGLLGEQYIGLEAGGDSKNLAAGDGIAMTQSAVVLENLIGQFLYGKAAEGEKKMRAGVFAAVVLAATLLLGGCASLPAGAGPGEIATYRKDPLEPMNRAVFGFNDAIDRAVLKPVSQAYADYVHEGVRTMVGNVFGNLGDLWTAVNQLLQGKPLLALGDLGRFTINTTLGFGGLGDVASEMGIPKHREDLGQTFGRWGVGAGPYLVLPFLGPSTIRDTVALPGDWAGDPVRQLDQPAQYWSAWTTRAVHSRAGLLPQEKLLDGAALDKYSFIRDGYLQRRRSLVYDGNPPDDDK